MFVPGMYTYKDFLKFVVLGLLAFLVLSLISNGVFIGLYSNVTVECITLNVTHCFGPDEKVLFLWGTLSAFIIIGGVLIFVLLGVIVIQLRKRWKNTGFEMVDTTAEDVIIHSHPGSSNVNKEGDFDSDSSVESTDDEKVKTD